MLHLHLHLFELYFKRPSIKECKGRQLFASSLELMSYSKWRQLCLPLWKSIHALNSLLSSLQQGFICTGKFPFNSSLFILTHSQNIQSLAGRENRNLLCEIKILCPWLTAKTTDGNSWGLISKLWGSSMHVATFPHPKQNHKRLYRVQFLKEDTGN